VGGIDAALGAALPLGSGGFELQGLLRYFRYFYAMNPEPGDALVAGGALDQFFTFQVGAAYAL
jgi:hypothetical protein